MPTTDALFASPETERILVLSMASGDQTAVTPLLTPSLCSLFRSILASVQSVVSEISVIDILSGSNLPHDSIELTTGYFLCSEWYIRKTLGDRVSIASTT